MSDIERRAKNMKDKIEGKDKQVLFWKFKIQTSKFIKIEKNRYRNRNF